MSAPNVEDIYPLSPAQHSMLIYLVLSGKGTRSEFYFDQLVATFGDLDPERLRRAWQKVHDRHAALRTLFLASNRERALQVVRKTIEVPWRQEDWRELPADEREQRFATFLVDDYAEGFDIEKAPLSRIALIRFGDAEWKFVWSFSHLVLDGWSMAIVLGEMAEIYNAERDGREENLPEVRPYREFVAWLEQQDATPAEEYWRTALAGFEPPTPLPFDGSGGVAHDEWVVAEARRVVSKTAFASLQALARSSETTLGTLLQTLWAQLLGRYAATTDVVVGGISSGRPFEVEGIESMVGLFINALPVRVRFDLSETLAEHLRRLQADQFEQREYEHFTYEQVLRWAGLPRNTPVYESLLVYQNYPVDAIAGSGAPFEVFDARMREANDVPLTLFVGPSPEGLVLRLAYHWRRFDRASAEKILDALEAMLLAVAENPRVRLADLPLTTPASRAEILALSTGEAPASQAPFVPVHQAVFAQAVRTPKAIAVEHEGSTLTYSELSVQAHQLAHRLHRLGLGIGDRVGVCLNRTLDLPVTLLAILEVGAAYLPLDPTYPAERLAHMLEDAGVRAVVATSDTASSLPENSVAQVFNLDRERESLAHESAEPLALDVPSTATAYVIYTSGSTGKPKGVLVPHRALAHYAHDAREAFEITANDRVLQFASINFDTSAEEIYPCWLAGGTLVLRSEEMISSIERFVVESHRLGITVLDLPTAYWHEWVAELADPASGLSRSVPDSLRLVILGGEAAQRDRWLAWRTRVGERVRLLNTYGPTEATIVSTRFDLTAADGAAFAQPPIGRPIAGGAGYIVDVADQLAAAGCDGELLIGGAGVTLGYLGRPDQTAERFVPDSFSGEAGARLYRTGDLVRRLPSGEIEFRGRTDKQVKIRGYRIELGEIEQALRALPEVRDAVVVAPTLEGGGRRLVAFFVASDPSAVPSVAVLREGIGGRLPDYMMPASFVALESLPMGSGGKVDRRVLEQRARDAAASGRPDLGNQNVAPRTPVEEVLAGIWSDILHIEKVGVHDDFFQLGGHSLLAAKLAARVRQAFDIELPMIDVFKSPTVAHLAEAIERARSGGETAHGLPIVPPIRRAPRDRSIPLSFPQERVWILDQLSAGGNIAYNFQATLFFRGPFDLRAFRATLTEIVRRHEIFRTRFPTVDGRPVQIIEPLSPIDLPLIDLRSFPEEERYEIAERILAESVAVPFDIAAGPLIRWRLLWLEDDLHELIQVEHHFVHDGWSFAALLREMEAIYPAFVAGLPSPLPDPEIQYADFATWQREWISGEVLDQLLGYWKAKLANHPSPVEFPLDHPRPGHPTFVGDLIHQMIPANLYQGLREWSRREGSTLYMTMLAGFFGLLYRYTGEEDLLIGTSNANRRAREIEGMLGMVVNTLLVRGDASGAPTFRAMVKRVRDLALEVYAYQDMPFERLVQELRPERQLGRNPLFQIMYNFHDAAVPDLEFGNLVCRFLVRGNRSAKVDLNVIVIPRAEQRTGSESREADLRAVLHWEWNTDLYDRASMERAIGHYLELLQGAVENGNRAFSELPLLTASERKHLASIGAAIGSAEAVSSPAVATSLDRRFVARAMETPDAVALTLGGTSESCTYSELDRRSNALAHALAARGVRAGDRVGVCLERTLDLPAALLGVLRAGAAYVPLDPAYPIDRLAYMAEDSGLAAIVESRGTAAVVSEIAASGSSAPRVTLDDLAVEADALPPRFAGDAALPAYVIYTSGSTGKPKGVVVSHEQVVRLFESTDAWFHFGPQDVWTLFHSYAFDFSVWELWGALLYGGRLVVVPYLVSRAPEDFYQLVADERVTVLNQTPSAFRQLIAAEEAALERGERGSGRDLALRTVVFGGEALDFRSLAPWFERHGDQVPLLVNMYGITETTVHVTYRPLSRADVPAKLGRGVTAPSAIGRAIPDLSLHLLDRDGNLAPLGAPAEIVVGGAGVAYGYLGRPALTAERFIPDPFGPPGSRLYRSGDLARRNGEGDLEYLGRIDHQVKIRGFRIELAEIESALSALPEVAESVVLVRADPTAGAEAGASRLVAWVAPRDGAPLVVSDLRAALAKSLPEYMIPAVFVPIAALPLTQNGKVDRRALPDPDPANALSGATGSEHVPPRDSTEETLVGIWREVLAVERIGVRDDFFALGGHSLSAARVLSRVRESLGVVLPLVVLFEQPTIEGLAREVSARAEQQASSGAITETPAVSAASTNTQDDALLARAAEMSDADLDALLDEMLASAEATAPEGGVR